MNNDAIRNAVAELLEAFGWTRHEEAVLTDEELTQFADGGPCLRDGHRIIMVGQTDTNGDTYAFADPADDGNILIAPYAAGDLSPPEIRRERDAIEALANAVFDEVPDSYVQGIVVRT